MEKDVPPVPPGWSHTSSPSPSCRAAPILAAKLLQLSIDIVQTSVTDASSNGLQGSDWRESGGGNSAPRQSAFRLVSSHSHSARLIDDMKPGNSHLSSPRYISYMKVVPIHTYIERKQKSSHEKGKDRKTRGYITNGMGFSFLLSLNHLTPTGIPPLSTTNARNLFPLHSSLIALHSSLFASLCARH
jgi:hypothetical protein